LQQLNILAEDSVKADYKGIPSAVNTIPVLAAVGIGAVNDSDKYKVVFRDRSNGKTIRSKRMEFTASKVIIDEANDRIIEAYILGPNAGEAISIFASIIRLGLNASDLKKRLFAFSSG